MREKPAVTPQALRDQAERAIRLAHSIFDDRAKAALLAHAEELAQKAVQIEAAVPTEAPATTETPIAAIAPSEATETADAKLDTVESINSSDVEDSN